MNEALPNFELLLREALAPVEPPADLVERVESALQAITEMAADELEAWELSAMRDPRNWVRPAAALVLGGTAGTALVLLRARRRSRDMSAVPRVTYALIAINVIAFLAEGNITATGGGLGNSVYREGALLGSSELPPFAGQGVAHGQWWRIVTGGFLHENLIHIGF